MHRIFAAAALALSLLAPASAHAGTYHVDTCAAAGRVWPNAAWRAVAASGVRSTAPAAAARSRSRHGWFTAHYRFRSAGSRGHRFQFRAQIRPAAGFPYGFGHSSTVTVRVR